MKKLGCLLIALMLLVGCSETVKEEVVQPPIVKEDEPKQEVQGDSVVTFVAVGDNLIHGAIYYDSEVRHDGAYEFDEVYENTNSLTQNADVAYVNQETILGGSELTLSHYPRFNSPHEVGEALVNAGFDWVASSSNHSLDRFEEGIVSCLNFWDQYPGVVTTGLNRSEEERQTPKFIERNGVKFGVLGYTYGTNGIDLPVGKEYLVNLIDAKRISEDIKNLEGQCDSIMVSMHWGNEYWSEPSEEQLELAQMMADLGVDVIIGEHPHVIQPMDWVEGKDGHQTLVIYSLGNFLSAQDVDFRMLGGMASWSMRMNGESGEVSVENVKFYPTITHFNAPFTKFKTYFLKDYTEELAATHGLNGYEGQLVTREKFVSYVDEVMNDKFEIVY